MKSLEERLREYPDLYERISELVAVVENAAGDVVKADEAEQRVIEELRQIGQSALQNWAARKQALVEQAAETDPQLVRKEKKVSSGRPA
jgi:flagellar biosynthesis/type III secretory pathway chaperone